MLAVLFAAVAAAGVACLMGVVPWIPAGVAWPVTVGAAILAVHEMVGRPLPFLRWSGVRLVLGMRRLVREWQVGDGREERAGRFVRSQAPAGDLDAAIAALDCFAYRRAILINVGDRKGALLEATVARVRPARVLEVGAYVGYSALRIARALPPGGRLTSVELNPDNASIARGVVAHAGAGDRVTFVVGSLGDGGATLDLLTREHGFADGGVDLVFLDHAKERYLPDLQLLLERGFLHPGTVVVADNIRFPGAPAYRAYMEEQEGRLWRTEAHATRLEYSALPDVVLVSTRL
jgi:catechol O-methyltransferase